MNKTFYFIFLHGDDPHANFNLHNANAIISNLIVNRPDRIELHTDDLQKLKFNVAYIEMESELRKLKEVFKTEFTVVAHSKSEYETYYGTRIPYLAHRSDILRLHLLEKYGGVYCDLDCIALHPMPNSWFEEDSPESKKCRMGIENDGSETALCNNVIVAPPHNKWIQSLLDIMCLYDPDIAKPGTDKWAYYSVQAPMKLYEAKSGEFEQCLEIMPPKTFQPIYLDYSGREDLFLMDKSDELLGDKSLYELHLWETANKSTLKYISQRSLTSGDYTYARVMRRIIYRYGNNCTENDPIDELI